MKTQKGLKYVLVFVRYGALLKHWGHRNTYLIKSLKYISKPFVGLFHKFIIPIHYEVYVCIYI